jgi:transcriptional regulator with PAS, ATPase and Fis domain
LIGGSEPMRRVYDAITRVADSTTTILIRGESGSGKELAARAIVMTGPRSEAAFISVNCAAIPESLIEAELFGHEKGAFTGAVASRAGHIEAAHGGTLFLDEIGSLPLPLQSKLLRVLEERTVQRIGGRGTKKVDFRLITATNEDLESAVREGRFREDLYYRLNVIPIGLPPLRERKEDIPELAGFFMRRFAAETKKSFTEITRDAEEKLVSYHWPGNVRELANVIERAVVLGPGPKLAAGDLPPRISAGESRGHSAVLSYRDDVAAFRKQLILRALDQTKGNRTAAAKALGLEKNYLLRLIKTLRIEL